MCNDPENVYFQFIDSKNTLRKYANVVISKYHTTTSTTHYFHLLKVYSFRLMNLKKISLLNKGNNKITELRTILQRESQNS